METKLTPDVSALEEAFTTRVQDIYQIIEKYQQEWDLNGRAPGGLPAQLGGAFIELKKIFDKINGKRHSGFYKWAAEEFSYNVKTIEGYIAYARNPEKARKRLKYHRGSASGDIAYNRMVRAFLRLNRRNQLKFISWTESYTSKISSMEPT